PIPKLSVRSPDWPIGHLEIQHKQRENDSEHAIAHRLQAIELGPLVLQLLREIGHGRHDSAPAPFRGVPSHKVSARVRWVLVWVFACLPLLGWWLTGLFDLDEGFYAAVTAEMNRRGEWITPYYNGQPWFEKPILLYWAAKPCVALFG